MSSRHARVYNMHIHKVHIADGFADDCEELIHRWLKAETLNYESFCVIWKDMQFNLLYHGRNSGAEMAELSEELVHIAKHYMVSNMDNFEESVAGLFLVYGLLHLQPYPGFACLRVVPDDVPSIARLETVARREKRYDVLYILASVLIEGPVQYHAAARERGMELSLRKYLEGTTGIDLVGVRPKGVFYRQTEELDLLRELDSITKRYSEAKQALGGENSRSLNYSNDKLPAELDSSLKEIINGITDDGNEANKKITEHYDRVQDIKKRAMKQTVDAVKHLDSVENRSVKKSKAKVKSKEEEPAQGKSTGKIGYPGTSEIPLYDRRRLNKKLVSSSESESSTTSTDDSDSDIDSLESFSGLSKTSANPHDKDESLNLENFGKKASLHLGKIDYEGQNNTGEENIQIQIDSLPVLIRSENNGQMFEIEIIDEMNQEIPNTAESELEKLPDVSVENVNTGEETASATQTEMTANTASTDNAETAEASTSSKKNIWPKLEKRYQKKTILKSKFKSMGLLSVANFKEKQNKSGARRKSERIRNKSESGN